MSISPTRLYVWILGTLVDIWGGYLLLDAALSHDQMKQPPGGGKGKKGENKGGKQVIGAHHLAQVVRPGMRRSAKMHRIRMRTHMFVLCGAYAAR